MSKLTPLERFCVLATTLREAWEELPDEDCATINEEWYSSPRDMFNDLEGQVALIIEKRRDAAIEATVAERMKPTEPQPIVLLRCPYVYPDGQQCCQKCKTHGDVRQHYATRHAQELVPRIHDQGGMCTRCQKVYKCAAGYYYHALNCFRPHPDSKFGRELKPYLVRPYVEPTAPSAPSKPQPPPS